MIKYGGHERTAREVAIYHIANRINYDVDELLDDQGAEATGQELNDIKDQVKLQLLILLKLYVD